MAYTTFILSSSAQDGYVTAAGGFNNDSTRTYIGNTGSTIYHSWAFFPNITVPKNAIINDARIRVWLGNGASVITTRIYFDKSANAELIGSYANFDAKSLTTNYVNWSLPTNVGAWTTSEDIKAIIQELVDQASWASGNDMQLLWKNNSAASWASMWSWEEGGDQTYAIRLWIDYTVNAGATATTMTANASFPTTTQSGTAEVLPDSFDVTAEMPLCSVKTDSTVSLVKTIGTGLFKPLGILTGKNLTKATGTGEFKELGLKVSCTLQLTKFTSTGEFKNIEVKCPKTLNLTKFTSTGEFKELRLKIGTKVYLTKATGTGEFKELGLKVSCTLQVTKFIGTGRFKNIKALARYKPPIRIESPINPYKHFLGARVEWFEYELLELNSTKDNYTTAGLLDTIESGMVTVDFTRDVIGTAGFTISGPQVREINYLTDKIKPWYCFTVNGTIYRYPLGVYFLNSPTIKSNDIMVSRYIQGFDNLLALQQNSVPYSFIWDKNYNIIESLRDILDDVEDNIGIKWFKHNIPWQDANIYEDIIYNQKNFLYICNGVLNAINYTPLWADANGVLRSQAWNENTNILWTFEDNKDSLYCPDISQEINYAEIYNKVMVVTQTVDTGISYYSELTFEDIGMADHPYSITSIGRTIGKRFDSEAVSQEYVDQRALRELLKMTRVEEAITYKHGFATTRDGGIPYVGDGYIFKNNTNNINSVYSIEKMSWSFDVGKTIDSIIRRNRYVR